MVLDSREIIKSSYEQFIPLPCPSLPVQPYQVHRDDTHNTEKDDAIERPRKKRKRADYVPNQPEQDFNDRHLAIEPALSQALVHLQEWMQKANLDRISSKFSPTRTQNADEPSEVHRVFEHQHQIPSSIDFVALAALRRVTRPKFLWTDSDDNETVNLYDQLISNDKNSEREATAFNTNVLIPAQSAFLMSDIKFLSPLLVSYKNTFHCIVIDPPWENRSVKRTSSASSYQMLPNKTLLKLPINQLSSPGGCLVALWVTNREKLRRFVEDELLSAWGLRHVATWHWLKIADNGRPVTPLVRF